MSIVDDHTSRDAAFTLAQKLDDALRGGVPCGRITELVGPAGVCMMLTMHNNKTHNTVSCVHEQCFANVGPIHTCTHL